jgi:hypothetical protein
MTNWNEFEKQAPDIAAAGWRLLRADGIAIGFLATVTRHGRPRMAPVCPIFANGSMYLSVGTHTPKLDDLTRNGFYVLHAFLGQDDEEFQMSGRAVEITDQSERVSIHSAIRFGAYDTGDPIFKLLLERCLWVTWENAGKPGTRSIYRRWKASSI